MRAPMAVLTRDALLRELAAGRLVIEPLAPDQVGPASIDLTLGDEIRVMDPGSAPIAMREDVDYRRLTRQLALENAGYGVRANVVLPGLMDTPMAVDTRARASGRPRAEVAAERDRRVPLRQKMGTAWDVANAALFLASDEANFITGVALPVDGGALVKVG